MGGEVKASITPSDPALGEVEFEMIDSYNDVRRWLFSETNRARKPRAHRVDIGCQYHKGSLVKQLVDLAVIPGLLTN